MANNLLDKSSIILTPTAYNNGEALCVKPSDGSGDFDFSRNSAATRVNAQGLVENVQILSSNLVQNGDFSEEGAEEVSNGSFSQEGAELVTNGSFDTDSDWTKGTGWSISGGTANCDGTQTINSNLRSQTFVVGSNPILKLTFDVVNYSSGLLAASVTGTGQADITNINANGTYSIIVVSSTGNRLVDFTADADFIGSIDNVSVREVGQDWTLGGEVTIGDNLAHFESNTNTYSYIRQDISSLTTKTYKIQLEVKNYVSGAVQVAFSGASPIAQNLNVSSDGVYTAYLTPNANGDDFEVSREFNGGNFNFDITNISVKEVGMDWDLNGWEISENKATCDASGGSALTILQQGVLTPGKTYKITYTILDYVQGVLRFRSSPVSGDYTSGNGEHTVYIVAQNATFGLQGLNGFIGSVTNISVIEITDDTNLPRISYENFSYQDALGSELILNGSFDTDSDWFKDANWSIANGVATSTGYGRMFQSIPFLEANVGTKVKVSFDITENTNGGVVVNCYGSVSQLFTSVGTHTFTATTINNTNLYFNNVGAGNNFIGSIDNVSVKEYLGQSVVPNSGCGHYLWEPQSTNLLPYSEDFSQWYKVNYTVQTNAAVSPSGNFDASFVTNPSGGGGLVRQAINVTPLTAYTFSFYAKRGTASDAKYSVYNNAGGGDIIPSTSYYSQINSDTFTRVAASFTTPAGCTSLALYVLRDSSAVGNTIVWGAQLEEQSYATSYIPTSGSTVTRNQDVCNNGATGTGLINSTEGVLYAEIARSEEQNLYRLLGIDDGTSNNYVKMGFENSRGAFWIRAVINGVTSISSDNALTSNPNEFYKIAIRYKSGNSAIYINGTSVLTTTTTFSSGNFTALDFNHWNNSLNFFGKTKCVAVWKEALSDSELQSLTTI